ncbi:unnamed protein product [Rhizopus stolonifer]
MFKKLFHKKSNPKENPKMFMDQASLTILNRHFSPLPIQTNSPSDLLDNVDNPNLQRAQVTPVIQEVEEEEEDISEQLHQLHRKLIAFEQERESWRQKLNGYLERETQLRRVIRENQSQINALRDSWSEEEYLREQRRNYYYPRYCY